MIEILDVPSDDIVGFRMDGSVDKADIDRVFTRLERAARGGRHVRVYADLSTFGMKDMSSEAVVEDVRRWLGNPRLLASIRRAAVVSDRAWITAMFEIECALVPTLTGAAFAPGEQEKALEWLRSHEPGASPAAWPAPDLTFRQLAGFGSLKAAGGFALGLLVANRMSGRLRTRLGWSVLVGAAALGGPLVRDILARTIGAAPGDRRDSDVTPSTSEVRYPPH